MTEKENVLHVLTDIQEREKREREWSRGNSWKDNNWKFSRIHDVHEYTPPKSQKNSKQDMGREILPSYVPMELHASKAKQRNKQKI